MEEPPSPSRDWASAPKPGRVPIEASLEPSEMQQPGWGCLSQAYAERRSGEGVRKREDAASDDHRPKMDMFFRWPPTGRTGERASSHLPLALGRDALELFHLSDGLAPASGFVRLRGGWRKVEGDKRGAEKTPRAPIPPKRCERGCRCPSSSERAEAREPAESANSVCCEGSV